MARLPDVVARNCVNNTPKLLPKYNSISLETMIDQQMKVNCEGELDIIFVMT